MQTEEDLDNEIAATNNAIIALQHKVFNRSNISFMFINRQATKDYEFLGEDEEYNRVIGIDYNLASKNNKLQLNHQHAKIHALAYSFPIILLPLFVAF